MRNEKIIHDTAAKNMVLLHNTYCMEEGSQKIILLSSEENQ